MPSGKVHVLLVGPGGGSPSWPDATTTGVQSGVTLTNWTGGQDLDGSTTYEGFLFPVATGGAPWYTVGPGSGFTMRNCRFQHDVNGNGGALLLNESDNSLIEYCEMTGISWSSVHTSTAQYCDVANTPDDWLHITGDASNRPDNRCLNITVHANYLHDVVPTFGSHSDGIQTLGVAGLTITGNNLDIGWTDPFGDMPLNSCIYLEDITGGTAGPVVIDGNRLNGAEYSVIFQAVSGTFQFTNNTFGPDAHFGLFSVYPGGLPSTQSGNVDSNGDPVTLVVNN